MESFKDLAAAVTIWVMFAFVTGHRQWVYDGIVFIRKHAVQESQKPRGCPSIFDRHACSRWAGGKR
jgi:hypothetical protein